MAKGIYQIIIAFCALFVGLSANAVERQKLDFNADWRICVGDYPRAVEASFDDSRWQRVTLPLAVSRRWLSRQRASLICSRLRMVVIPRMNCVLWKLSLM